MLNINIRFFWGILFVLLLTICWCGWEVYNAITENNRLNNLPNKEQTFNYPKPIMDTDLMNMAKAGYLMGIEREGKNEWVSDSTLLRSYIFKPIKLNQNDISKIN